MTDIEEYFSDKDRIKELEKQVESLQKRAVINRNDKYKYKLRVERFFKCGGVSIERMPRERAIFLIKLVNEGLITLTIKQIAAVCFIGCGTIYKLSKTAQ